MTCAAHPHDLRRRPWAALLVLVTVLAALALAACGDDDEQSASTTAATTEAGTAALPSETKATLVLDFVPNAVHAGIYRAVAAGYYRDNNIDLKIIEPTSTADTLKLIDAGKADFGIADGIDVASQIDGGQDAQGIMALVQRPLGGLITLKDAKIEDPSALEGKKVGVTGVPSDNAILETIMRDAGADPKKAEVITIGFNGVQNLESGKVDAFTGFWPADGVQLDVAGKPTRTFKLDEYGGPAYPGLVVFSTRKRIREDGPLMKAFVDATVKGYNDTIENPEQALADLLAENKALKRNITEAQLRAYGPLFQADERAYGVFNEDNLQALSEFLVDNDLTKKPIPPERFATSEFLPQGG